MAKSLAAAEREVFLGDDAALAALEDEDRKIWAMLTEPDVPSGEITPERRRRCEELSVRWCEIIRGTAALAAHSMLASRASMSSCLFPSPGNSGPLRRASSELVSRCAFV